MDDIIQVKGIDFSIKDLIQRAEEVRSMAYTPYSTFKVGACLVDNTQSYHLGVNIENASYGLTSCAERNAVFSAITHGAKSILALCVIGDTEAPISPCGACRQVLSEFTDKDTVFILTNLSHHIKIVGLEELLPFHFSLHE